MKFTEPANYQAMILPSAAVKLGGEKITYGKANIQLDIENNITRVLFKNRQSD